MPATIGGAAPTQAQSLALALAFGHPYILAQSAVPRILLSSATSITAAGLITGLTALPYTPSGVVIVYCFAQAGLTAGLYYARFSSTTSCQLYSDAAGTVVLSGITAGAYAGGTTEVTLATVTVPGGAMGANGALRIVHSWGCANNANSKTVRSYLNSVQFGGANIPLTSSLGVEVQRILRNRGVTNINVCLAGSASTSLTTGSQQSLTIDTSTAQSLTVACTSAVATDYIILDGYTIEVLPGA